MVEALENIFRRLAPAVWREFGWRGLLAILLVFSLLAMLGEVAKAIAANVQEKRAQRQGVSTFRLAIAVGWHCTKGLRIAVAIDVGLLLTAASISGPYLLYFLIKTVTAATCAYLCYVSIRRSSTAWPWFLGVTAVLFNPILPVRMQRGDWFYLDLIAALVLAAFFASQFWSGYWSVLKALADAPPPKQDAKNAHEGLS